MKEKGHLPSEKKIQVALFIIDTIGILYFMFFGFARLQFAGANQEYRFSIIPTGIPLWFPKKISFLWLFSLGNLLAFVPFGILAPMIFGTRYLKFILIFLISILLLEVVQMITYLGSFDIEDIITNAMGATIGFLSYKIGNQRSTTFGKAACAVFLILVFTLMAISLAEIL